MTIKKNLEERTVDEAEFVNAMTEACKTYVEHISEIQTVMNKIDFYKTNGYRIKYTFNDKTNEYLYHVSKRRIGFI